MTPNLDVDSKRLQLFVLMGGEFKPCTNPTTNSASSKFLSKQSVG